MNKLIPGYRVSSERQEMDVKLIHGYLTTAYWAKNIPLATVQLSIENSLCFGIFTNNGQQVAFARMITDYATFAYLSDVFVLTNHRGLGLSKWLIQTMIKHPKLQGLRRIALATSDAHGLYQQFGFTLLNSPEMFMELHRADMYTCNSN